MKKFILALLSIFMLTGCGTSMQALAQEAQNTAIETPNVVEVINITTDQPIVELHVNETYLLQYTVLPENATDKSVTVDLTYATHVVVERDAEDESIIMLIGKFQGTGIVSLITNNGKFVSYTVTVYPAPPTPPVEPLVYEAENVAEYYNYYTPYEPVEYISTLQFTGWGITYDYGPAPSVIGLATVMEPIREVRKYLPISGIRKNGYLYHLGDGYYKSPTDVYYYLSVEVSSNWFAAVSLFCYVSEGNLVLDLLIYDGRNTLYTGLQ